MSRFQHRFVALLSALLLANAALWSFSSDAMKDALVTDFAAVGIVITLADNTATSQPAHHEDGAGQTCNHGCHAASHMQGQTSEPFNFFSPPVATAQFANTIVTLSSVGINGLYRPPKISSQA